MQIIIAYKLGSLKDNKHYIVDIIVYGFILMIKRHDWGNTQYGSEYQCRWYVTKIALYIKELEYF